MRNILSILRCFCLAGKLIFFIGFLTACGGLQEEDEPELPLNTNNGYSQCYGRVDGYNDLSRSINHTVQEYIRDDVEIQCTDRYSFDLEGKPVELVYIAYGKLQDCASGCFSSHVCVVYEENDPLLYSASWINSERSKLGADGRLVVVSKTIEQPLNLAAGGCGDIPEGTGSTHMCETKPEAVGHPLFESTDFEMFLGEVGDSWRFCGRDFR